MATRAISVIDLLSVPEMKEIVMERDVEAFTKAMWDSGFDTQYGLMYQVCWHRTFFDKTPVYTGRFVSEERSDKEWMNSGNASYEKRLEQYGKTDREFQRMLIEMNAYPNFTGIVIDNMEKHSGHLETELFYKEEENED